MLSKNKMGEEMRHFLEDLDIVNTNHPKIVEIKNHSAPPLHPLYTLIRFWGRIPYYLLSDLISNFQDKKILFDPFGGSGAVVFVGLTNGFSRIIYNDLNPVFVFIAKSIYEGLKVSENDIVKAMNILKDKILSNKIITDLIKSDNFYITKFSYITLIKLKKGKLPNTIKEDSKLILNKISQKYSNEWINILSLREEFTRKTKNKIQSRAKFSVHLNHLLENKVIEKKIKLESVTLSKNLLLTTNPRIITSDKFLNKIIKKEKKYKKRIYKKPFSFELRYSNGNKFMKSDSATTIGDLFTDWSKIILSEIWREIASLKVNKEVKNTMKLCFLASLYDSSKMQMPHKSGWIIKSFWIPPYFGVKNPVSVFFKKLDHFLKVYKTLKKEIKNNCIAEFYNKDILDFTYHRKPDLVITHPPYFSTVQYGELSTIWAPWIDAKIPFENEIIQNPRQQKDKNSYLEMLKKALERISMISNKNSTIALIFQTKNLREWKLLEKILLEISWKLKEIRCYKRISCWNSKHLFNIGSYDYVFIFENRRG